ncbi:ABC transporter [Proteus mirabilis]|nr:ABC transporter [Proteus mirabilis]
MNVIKKASQIPLISLSNINKSVGDKSNKKSILKNITFNINNNDFTLIRYQYDNEEDALINIISGIDIKYTGYAYLSGCYLHSLNEKQRALLRNEMIGFISRNNYFFYDFSVFDDIDYSILNYKYKKNREYQIINSLKFMGIEKLCHQRIKTLSSEQLLKVAFARVLAKKPKCIIANYNNSSFNQDDFYYFIQLLLKIHTEFSMPILLTTSCNGSVSDVNNIMRIKNGELYDEEKC